MLPFIPSNYKDYRPKARFVLLFSTAVQISQVLHFIYALQNNNMRIPNSIFNLLNCFEERLQEFFQICALSLLQVPLALPLLHRLVKAVRPSASFCLSTQQHRDKYVSFILIWIPESFRFVPSYNPVFVSLLQWKATSSTILCNKLICCNSGQSLFQKDILDELICYKNLLAFSFLFQSLVPLVQNFQLFQSEFELATYQLLNLISFSPTR